MDGVVSSKDKISTGLSLVLSQENDGSQTAISDRQYTIILRYLGSFPDIQSQTAISMIPLLNGFAVGTAAKEAILQLATQPQILYIDITHQMEYEQAVSVNSRISACFPMYDKTEQRLRGNGVLVGIVDSGIDFFHPAFLREDGTYRIRSYWDQAQSGNSPEPYGFGTQYSEAQIGTLMQRNISSFPLDTSGHGTAVASIVAALSPDADMIGVATLPNTAAFLCAVDYVVRYAMQQTLPLVLNLSYGNNYGDHQGNAIVELYLETLRANGKITIVTGTGNEGNTGRHRYIEGNMLQHIGFLVGESLQIFNLQLWFAWGFRFLFRFNSPSGNASPYYDSARQGYFYQELSDTSKISVQIGLPTPYNVNREIFIQFQGNPIPYGYWNLTIIPYQNQSYQIHAWLPVAASTPAVVEFEIPTSELSLTVPSSLSSVISVGAYNQMQLSLAPFSGKGGGNVQKPDVIAPGVDILVANAGGGYALRSGTSFATPFVSAAAANLMQWGITDGNDPFLYGERLKAYLTAAADPLPGRNQVPNFSEGWGRLCANASVPESTI